MAQTIYAIGIGSNRRGRHGGPADEVRAAIRALGGALGGVIAVSPILATAPLGPSIRRFANAAVLVESDEAPPALLARLKRLEAAFGRRRGRRWGERVIDLDILLWSRGPWRERRLTVPHAALARRPFVLWPLAAIAPDWRMPRDGRTIRQLADMVDRPRPRA